MYSASPPALGSAPIDTHTSSKSRCVDITSLQETDMTRDAGCCLRVIRLQENG